MYGEMIPAGLGVRRVTSSRGRAGCRWNGVSVVVVVVVVVVRRDGVNESVEGALAGRARFSLAVWPD
jgi:hypothetical protein